jgi:hypothetical protein
MLDLPNDLMHYIHRLADDPGHALREAQYQR